MADQAKGAAIRETIAARLRTISQAAGFRTDIGANVSTEPARFDASKLPTVTVYPGHKQWPQDAGSKTEREIRVVVEVLVSAGLDDAAAVAEAAEADIEDALRNYTQMPMALPAQFEESVILDRPDGLAAVAIQVMLVTRYR